MYEVYVEIEPNVPAYEYFIKCIDDSFFKNWDITLNGDYADLKFEKKFIDLEDAQFVADRLMKRLKKIGIPKKKIVQLIEDWSE